ncbi:MAG: translation initiation factor IF-2 subunit beta [Candidatus ainarchaeum sp.]|nr:translation initiation factor IF-2 subunit beta [Candidatus ainarchaeum sp.]MDD3085582.1 translation initiation factor IF-2 subunit beta [Candidatus ainarchaeum sp.]MDD4128352.1 translation initiation factor IF-2 subunit beta [Candidatus ainarchaeum sp.]MDD4467850.1 translation initiation factor IF-2 subunit beta [Candidatus ainarchaeum sp.]
MTNYENLLLKAYNSIPKKALTQERFEVPKVDSFLQGTKTIVKGFNQLLDSMRRDKKHFIKWLMKETALPISEVNNQLIINGKVNSYQLNKLIESYFKQFILCPECKKPDTKVITEGGTKLLKCEACGAIKSVSGL